MNRIDRIEGHRELAFWNDHNELAALYSYLVAEDLLDHTDESEVAYFLSKPWKWLPEWNRMRAASATQLEHRLNASLANTK